jgi:hypothetical protein
MNLIDKSFYGKQEEKLVARSFPIIFTEALFELLVPHFLV